MDGMLVRYTTLWQIYDETQDVNKVREWFALLPQQERIELLRYMKKIRNVMKQISTELEKVKYDK